MVRPAVMLEGKENNSGQAGWGPLPHCFHGQETAAGRPDGASPYGTEFHSSAKQPGTDTSL